MTGEAESVGQSRGWQFSDEYCPHCDNHFVLDAKTPQAALKVESEDTRVDARYDIDGIAEDDADMLQNDQRRQNETERDHIDIWCRRICGPPWVREGVWASFTSIRLFQILLQADSLTLVARCCQRDFAGVLQHSKRDPWISGLYIHSQPDRAQNFITVLSLLRGSFCALTPALLESIGQSVMARRADQHAKKEVDQSIRHSLMLHEVYVSIINQLNLHLL